MIGTCVFCFSFSFQDSCSASVLLLCVCKWRIFYFWKDFSHHFNQKRMRVCNRIAQNDNRMGFSFFIVRPKLPPLSPLSSTRPLISFPCSCPMVIRRSFSIVYLPFCFHTVTHNKTISYFLFNNKFVDRIEFGKVLKNSRTSHRPRFSAPFSIFLYKKRFLVHYSPSHPMSTLTHLWLKSPRSVTTLNVKLISICLLFTPFCHSFPFCVSFPALVQFFSN